MSDKKKLNPEWFADLKIKTRCSTCNTKGHWAFEHSSNIFFSPDAVVIETGHHQNQNGVPFRIYMISFNKVLLDNEDKILKTLNGIIGSLSDDEALYSEMSIQ